MYWSCSPSTDLSALLVKCRHIYKLVSALAISMPKNFRVKSTSDLAGDAIVRAASIFTAFQFRETCFTGRKFDHPSRKIYIFMKSYRWNESNFVIQMIPTTRLVFFRHNDVFLKSNIGDEHGIGHSLNNITLLHWRSNPNFPITLHNSNHIVPVPPQYVIDYSLRRLANNILFWYVM